ncbi:MAG: histone deacetylase family protein [Candidatus Bathyarchaeota archaeon]|nr:MAG: histone deacetylase family protein [Candidatus Bathyarchaeota archaeon]
MKVVHHKEFRTVYSSDPASAPGRMESIYKELRGRFEFVKPELATKEDLRLVHGESHINSIKRHEMLYEVAILAVGGAVKASELAMQGEPAFGLIRPPGHHASQNSCWGFCFFNNVAISIEKLTQAKKIAKALIVDIDLHYGDGTANIFSGTPQVTYFHVEGGNRETYLNDLARCLTTEKDCDIVAVSAGFDRHEQDWGGLLKTEDYKTIGRRIKEFAEQICQGRRYGVLEGGYNHAVLGKNVKSLLEGMT